MLKIWIKIEILKIGKKQLQSAHQELLMDKIT